MSLLSLPLIALFAGQVEPPPATETGLDPRVLEFLDVLEEVRAKTRTPGAGIALVVEGELAYLGGTGLRDIASGAPADEDTLFAIGSCTKAFTGLLAGKRFEDGTIAQDVPVSQLVEGLRFQDPYLTENVLLIDMLTHTTGVGNFNRLWYGIDRTRASLLDALPHMDSYFSLRRQYAYNNAMYGVIGLVLESVAEQSWDELIRSEIFAPLGMESSTTSYAEFMDHPNRSTGYDFDGRTALPHLDIDVIGPAGSIGSTARDMAAWLLWATGAKEQENLASAELRAFVTAPHRVVRPQEGWFYGLGWEVKLDRGVTSIGHGGGIVGQNGYVHAVPEAGFGIVLLANQQSDFDDLLIRYAEDLFVHGELVRDEEWEARLESTIERREEARLSAQALLDTVEPNEEAPFVGPATDYAGLYTSPGFPPIEIQARGADRLVLRMGQWQGPVKHEVGEQFVAYLSPDNIGTTLELTFLLSPPGAGGGQQRVVGLEVPLDYAVPSTVFAKQAASDLEPKIGAYVEEILDRYGIPGAGVAILKDGELVHRAEYGLADAQNGREFDAGTLFRIYSLTKLFSSVAVLQLVEAGKVALADPIGKHVAGLPETWRPVRVDQLLSHASGLPDMRDLYHLPEDELRKQLFARDFEHEPGTRYAYSLTGYWLLQKLVEAASGEPFQDFVLNGQLGSSTRRATFSANLSVPVANAATPSFPFEVEHDQEHAYLDASNGLLITLDEFVRWSQRLHSGALISAATKRLLWQPFSFREPKDFAHGWQIHAGGSERSYGFSGSMVTAYRAFPERKLEVLFLGTGLTEFFDVEDVIEELARRVG